MTPAERAFYDWWHAAGDASDYVPKLREVFVAGWNAAHGTTDDEPPDYEHAEAERAEEHAAAQREPAAIEAEEAHDAAGEAWYEATYGPFNTGPGGA